MLSMLKQSINYKKWSNN